MSKGEKLKLIKIILETKDGKQVSLTIDEAKELHDQLHALFGKKTISAPSYPIVVERDRWIGPYQPYWYGTTTTTNTPAPFGNEVLCSISGDSGISVSYCGGAV